MDVLLEDLNGSLSGKFSADKAVLSTVYVLVPATSPMTM